MRLCHLGGGGGTFIKLIKIGLVVPPIPPATNACIDGDEKKQLAEEELSTDSEDEDNDDPSEDEDSEDSSFDQLIDVNME